MELPTTPAKPLLTPTPISIHEMQDFVDAESMRVVRNKVRGFMTHNTNYIVRRQQMRWYHRTYRPARLNGQMYGFVLQQDSDPVGYGMIQQKDGVYWVGGGLTEEARGQGAGRKLFSFLTRYTHAMLDQPEVWLDVREDNPAQHLYTSLGYTAVGHNDGLIVMKHVLPAEDPSHV